MKFTEEQLAKIKAAKSAEDLIAIAKAEGIEATEEQIKAQFDAMHKEGELADEELEKVNGGYVTKSPNDRLCPRCGEYKAFVSEFLYEDPTKCYSKICCTACGYQGNC